MIRKSGNRFSEKIMLTQRDLGSGSITMSTSTTGTAGFKPALWTPGDWNAFFGFGTNILVNMLVLTGLLRFVLKMPDSLVFGRILPALGLMMCLSTFYYAWLAYRLAQKTGRSDVCALPSGVSVPHMFIVTFVIMLPITLKTGDPMKGWAAGLVWVFFQSFILMIGGFIAPYIRRITPRAALLGTLAGVSVTFISMRPALELYMTPQIGIICFAIILVSWFGGVKYLKGIPAGLVAIAAGMIIAWGSTLFGLDLGGLSVKGVGDAFASFGFSVPLPAIGQVFSGFEFLGIILVTAIPFGIYDLVEAMDNVESAEAAGDEYPTTRVLTADGVVSLIGCLMGNPFINAVYIGHPGWKAMGGRIGYSAATGIMVVVLSWFGIISVMLALVPVVAISPILLYIGMLIGAQAFQTTPVKHAPAVVLALTPHLAAWAKLQVDTMLGATVNAAQSVGGLAADKVGAVKAAAIASLPQQGVLYRGLEVMGGGSILAGLVLGAIGVFIIERDFVKASAFAFAGAVLTYFGFMHGEAVGVGGGFGVTPGVALAYAVVAAAFLAVGKFGTSTSYVPQHDMPLAAPAE
jgi:AGZA family xanthine/uracil permease-like MFS transporter